MFFPENYPNYCPQEHTTFQGKCYKLYREQSRNKKAEESCNMLAEGHLVAYHTKEEYDFVVSLTASVVQFLCKKIFPRRFYSV